jgi:predicted transglutaminase-like cysteine proteinase
METVAISPSMLSNATTNRKRGWRSRLASLSAVAFISALLLGWVLADVAGVTPEMVQWAKDKYGEIAGDRVVAWEHLMTKHQDKEERSKLKLVNDFFNRLSYSTDQRLWGKKDYWATPLEALGKGGADCEDYSIAKYFTLREMGVPDEKMRIMYVKALNLDEAHMVLTYYPTPQGVPLVLDNLKGKILPATKRTDLAPVYSFNGDGLWLAKSRGSGKRVGTSKRISLWQDLNSRMGRERKEH